MFDALSHATIDDPVGGIFLVIFLMCCFIGGLATISYLIILKDEGKLQFSIRRYWRSLVLRSR